MENNILQLMNIITALYFDDLAEDNGAYIIEELQHSLVNIKTEGRGTACIGSEDAAIESLRYTAEWMLTSSEGGYSRENILQRVKVNLQGNNDYIDIIENSLDVKVTADDARKKVNEILSELRFEKGKSKLRKLISVANAKLNFSGEYIENAEFIRELQGELEELGSSKTGEITGHIGSVNFDDPDAIKELLSKSIEGSSDEGLISIGLQGIDRAFNKVHRGSMVNVNACTHCYKSGMLLDIAMNIPVYNDPWMWDADKKPLILRISFENTLEQDITNMYKKYYELKYGKRCKMGDINLADATKELRDHFSSRGYHFAMEAYDPNNFTVYDLFDVLNKYLENGFEIHAVTCDYLSMIAHNTFGDREEMRIQKTFEMARNFCFPKGITFFTAHQLSTEAQAMSKENPTTITKKVCTGGYTMACKGLSTKMDLEIYLHVHNHFDGNKYLLFSRGKDRFNNTTPLVDQHGAYMFQEFGGIVPDVGLVDMSLRKLPSANDISDINTWDD